MASGIGGISGALYSALTGLQNASSLLYKTAEDIARSDELHQPQEENAAHVTLSEEALNKSREESPPLEQSMVDLRVAKYLAMANVRVATTTQDTERSLFALGGAERSHGKYSGHAIVCANAYMTRWNRGLWGLSALLFVPRFAYGDTSMKETGCHEERHKPGDDCIAFRRDENPSGGYPITKIGPGTCAIDPSHRGKLLCKPFEKLGAQETPKKDSPAVPPARDKPMQVRPPSSCACQSVGQPSQSGLLVSAPALFALGVVVRRLGHRAQRKPTK